ncbi:hypothetical protein CF326_g5516 [Tilletia indica]|nr:hypothetical protein CF326_g5516 [Tilletia indica]
MDNPSSTSPTVTSLKRTSSVSLVHSPILIKAGPPFFSSLGRPTHSSRPSSRFYHGTLFFQLRFRLRQDWTLLDHAPPDGRPAYPIKTSPMPSLSTGHPPVSASSPVWPPSLPRLGTRRPLTSSPAWSPSLALVRGLARSRLKIGHPPLHLKSRSTSLPRYGLSLPPFHLRSWSASLPLSLGTRSRPLKCLMSWSASLFDFK